MPRCNLSPAERRGIAHDQLVDILTAESDASELARLAGTAARNAARSGIGPDNVDEAAARWIVTNDAAACVRVLGRWRPEAIFIRAWGRA